MRVLTKLTGTRHKIDKSNSLKCGKFWGKSSKNIIYPIILTWKTLFNIVCDGFGIFGAKMTANERLKTQTRNAIVEPEIAEKNEGYLK